MKVLVCDYTGISAQWLEQFTIRQNFEVVGTITPASDKSLLSEKSWDYLLIFEQGARPFFMTLTQFMNIPAERVIFAMDAMSWAMHPAAAFSLINPEGGGQIIHRSLMYHLGRQLNYFMTCTTAEGFNYIATSRDDILLKLMYLEGKNHAADEMEFFQKLVKTYYNVDDSAGLFLDLGANIGTTGIYFTNKLAPNLKLLAFEPDPENFKLLRANLILNDAEAKTIAENLGLGVEESEQTMYRDVRNPGHNGIFSYQDGAKSETIKIVSLDKYFTEKNLRAQDIKYIWIDTEGFEPQVLLGAKNLLTENPAPVFMEFNPKWWQKSGFYEKMMDLLTPLYSSYIWVKEAMDTKNTTVYPLEKLWEFQTSTIDFGMLGDIFLIKKS